ncbi:hypothetical protein PR003_g17592 [Phytophthora rubi]|uniref:Uncharacterized protein n=1 Tax=Phytophthora rubi TaxID=129364 RepID=A0A6A4EDL3_9STRA|nr:hypothetical protein PR001_g12958 [Phytophthora rubi]KAE9037014.1 hypothetical protein PR002_g6792 [Phytophthora rubi]KAE9320933.1 hypothetical protein PR003_g17592 [Phytophthora rubi]
MLVKYYLESRVPESGDDYTAVDRDMKALKMDTTFLDAESLVGKLIDDIEIVIIKTKMNVVIRVQEPTKIVSYLVSALVPPAFKQAVQRKLSQEQYNAYKKDVVFFEMDTRAATWLHRLERTNRRSCS